MINQFTNSYRSTAPLSIFAGRPETAPCALTLGDYSIAGTGAEKSARPVFTVTDRHTTGQFRLETDVVTCPVATSKMTTPVANFWKQLIGGNTPPAPEPLLLT